MRRKKYDHLTMDCIAARKAGLSYGNFKAVCPVTVYELEEALDAPINPESEVSVCPQCGRKFVKIKHKTTKRFCSVYCQNRFNADKARDAARARRSPVKCRICGTEFMANKYHHVYCSGDCQQTGGRLVNKRYQQNHKLRNLEKSKEGDTE